MSIVHIHQHQYPTHNRKEVWGGYHYGRAPKAILLMTPIRKRMITYRQKTYSLDPETDTLFLDFIGALSGLIIRAKLLHWAAWRNSTHTRLDELHTALATFQDSIAEGYMGIKGANIDPTDVPYTPSDSNIAYTHFIDEVIEKITKFYTQLPTDTIFKGISGECEAMIQTTTKLKYLLTL